jgi:hypothetical protein
MIIQLNSLFKLILNNLFHQMQSLFLILKYLLIIKISFQSAILNIFDIKSSN